MKCQSCGKKEATVRYIENINGKKQVMHFCVECAKKLGFVDFSSMFSPIFTNIPKFFGKLDEEVKCKMCGYTFDDYTHTGMFGCPKCYDTFSDRLDEIFLKFHGKNRHIKLISEDVLNKSIILSQNDKILKLKEELKELVEKEEYEKAAIIRDKIKKIENSK